VDLNGTVFASQDEDDLFESCCSFLSLDHGVSNGAMHAPYFDPLQLSAKDAGKPHSRRDFHHLEDLWNPSSLPSGNYKNAIAASTNTSDRPRAPAVKDDSSAANRNMSANRHFVANASDPESLLNRKLNSLHVSSDGSFGQSWLTNDLTRVTDLSDLLDSSCSLHSVRIERQPVADDGDNSGKHSSLVEAVLIPTDDVDADTSCQHGNLECSYLSDDRIMSVDWKTSSGSSEVEVTVPASVKSLSAVELRKSLSEYGETPGPVTDSTRRLHELRLSKLMTSSDKHKAATIATGTATASASAVVSSQHHLSTGRLS